MYAISVYLKSQHDLQFSHNNLPLALYSEGFNFVFEHKTRKDINIFCTTLSHLFMIIPRLARIFATAFIFRRKYHQRKELILKRLMQYL